VQSTADHDTVIILNPLARVQLQYPLSSSATRVLAHSAIDELKSVDAHAAG
jgi:hypothetical protein